ncbi:hypothetical protein Sme01_21770 [Sphaerisporangium melleum]|uniref:Uncharacterized protein n=1 Tax=Sphaerisporangium melleum TaxID=321316 RepID=A0A917R0A0_9ACTN|nr:DUF6223 family protein [Sphaerisporangium melleum]GGK79436.1 hypothetical protein GCM10007964_22610 [Sphaerisporangium melleum]GII69701.1 hypothetical protein Sme01_21770 [Sphaerisporangium melleum]
MPLRRHLLSAASSALPGGFAHILAQPAPVSASTLTTGRLWSLVAALLGLAGVVIGGLALARASGRIGAGTGRRGAFVALGTGLAGAVIGGLVVAAAKGGPGTGYGIVGGYLAVVVGLVALLLGALALTRSRRTSV